eukprot:TRINITY_DN69778_c0_g2_i2.p1 TRINITY_DN69778_c0_g2~~TRINITY_DN69778_c0_g2_i2.p1  ORF type:complete len:280 (-),score=30.76 TRINITY_DN69778_c0_g2_i2:127-966(-)
MWRSVASQKQVHPFQPDKENVDMNDVDQILPALLHQIRNCNNREELMPALNKLRNHYSPSQNIQLLLESGVCPRLLELIMHQSQEVARASLDVLSIVAGGNNDQVIQLLDYGILKYIYHILISPEYEQQSRTSACAILAGIAGLSDGLIQRVIEADLMGPVMQQVAKEGNEQAGNVVANMIYTGNGQQIGFLLQNGLLDLLALMLDSDDNRLVIHALDGIEGLLMNEYDGMGSYSKFVKAWVEEGDCLGKIKQLAFRSSFSVQDRVSQIIDNFFSTRHY